MAPTLRCIGRCLLRLSSSSSAAGGESARQQALRARGLPTKTAIAGVDKVLLVLSGKGGVGKSTTAVNLALALSQVAADKSVGLLDADVYGPSIPKMMNTAGRLAGLDTGDRRQLLRPVSSYGLKTLSMGNLVEDAEAPVVWRGLMVMSAVQRLLRQVAWGPLDYLVVDMPPGTGDVQLSIAQSVPVAGGVVVTTPQEVALLDARKGAAMLAKVDIPVMGLVLNMAHHACPSCGHEAALFGGRTGVQRLAAQLGVPVLADVPLAPLLSEGSDAGRPVVVADPESALAQIYVRMAEQVAAALAR